MADRDGRAVHDGRRRRRWTGLVIAVAALVVVSGCATGSSPWPGGTWRPGAETFGMTVQKDVPIPMSDGVTLMADVGYPTDLATGERAAGPFPVLLSQNPYSPIDGLPLLSPDPYFVKRGYVFVVVDVRGTTDRSPAPVEADAQFFGPRNAQDGVEAVDFVAHHLAGSNGVVGLIGCSFLGINQLFTAAKIGPGSPVKAMAPACAGMGYETFFDGGIPSFTLGAFGIDLGADWKIAINGAFGKQLHDEIDAGGDAAYNRRFWQLRNAVDDAKAIVDSGIPALLWSGYQALEVQGAIDLYSALQNASAGRNPYAAMRDHQPVTGRYQIVVGEQFHAVGLDSSFQLEWFDHWLKGADNGIDRTSTPMHVFETGSNRWLNTDRLPIGRTTPFYLDAAGGLDQSTPDATTADIRWAQPTESGTTLTAVSQPLDRTMSVAGPIAATVYASSTTTDMELIATLEDVAPDGTATKVSDGSLIGSMRETDRSRSWIDDDGRMVKPHHPFTHDVPLVPGAVERFDIKMDTIVHSVPAGHSLRVTISTQAPSSSCGFANIIGAVGPAIPCNPTKPQLAALAGSTYTVRLGGRAATVVNVPLVEPSELAETLACTTPTSWFATKPMKWDGGSHEPRDPLADAAACLGAYAGPSPDTGR